MSSWRRTSSSLMLVLLKDCSVKTSRGFDIVCGPFWGGPVKRESSCQKKREFYMDPPHVLNETRNLFKWFLNFFLKPAAACLVWRIFNSRRGVNSLCLM